MPLPRGYISYNQYRSYRICPRRYAWVYVEGNRPVVNDKVFLGMVFHQVAEYYLNLKLKGTTPETGDVCHQFDQLFHQATGEAIVWTVPRERVYQRGRFLVRHFLAEIGPTLSPCWVEETFESVLEDEQGQRLSLKGIVDLVEPGHILTDFKTTVARWDETRSQNSLMQMWLYARLYRERFGVLPNLLRFRVLLSRKGGTVRSLISDHPVQVEKVDEAVRALFQVGHAIDQGRFDPVPGAFCRQCERLADCREGQAASHRGTTAVPDASSPGRGIGQ